MLSLIYYNEEITNRGYVMIDTQKEKPYYLYWIHRPCHKDMTKEGYIGITKNPDTRYQSHKLVAKADNKYIISRAIRKYNDLEYTILCCGSRKYIIDLEYKLRPQPNIGWNIAIGGLNCNLGKILSDDEKLIVALRTTKLDKNDIVKMIVDYYINNLTYEEISKKFCVSGCTVARHIKGDTILYPELKRYREKIKSRFFFNPRNPKTLTEKIYNEILYGREHGMTFDSLSKKYGICETYIADICYGNLDFLKNFSSFRVVKKEIKTIEYDCKNLSLSEWSKITGIKLRTLYYRLKNNWPVEKILLANRGDICQ